MKAFLFGVLTAIGFITLTNFIINTVMKNRRERIRKRLLTAVGRIEPEDDTEEELKTSFMNSLTTNKVPFGSLFTDSLAANKDPKDSLKENPLDD